MTNNPKTKLMSEAEISERQKRVRAKTLDETLWQWFDEHSEQAKYAARLEALIEGLEKKSGGSSTSYCDGWNEAIHYMKVQVAKLKEDM